MNHFTRFLEAFRQTLKILHQISQQGGWVGRIGWKATTRSETHLERLLEDAALGFESCGAALGLVVSRGGTQGRSKEALATAMTECLCGVSCLMSFFPSPRL